MTCDELRANIQRLDLCTGSEMRAMITHQDNCPDCQQWVRQRAGQYRHRPDDGTEELMNESLRKLQKTLIDPEV